MRIPKTLESLLYAFTFGGVLALVMNITRYNWLVVKITNWYAGLGLARQVLVLGGSSLVMWAPVIIMARLNEKRLHSYSAHKYGTDSETGEPIKSLAQIRAELAWVPCLSCEDNTPCHSHDGVKNPHLFPVDQKGG